MPTVSKLQIEGPYTTAERDALSGIPGYLVVFNSDTERLDIWDIVQGEWRRGDRGPIVGSTNELTSDVGNSTTVETNLYHRGIDGTKFQTHDRDKIYMDLGGVFVASATATRQLRVKFAGTTILDTGALSISAASSWHIEVFMIRTSSSTARASCRLQTSSAALASYCQETDLTGLSFAGSNDLVVTGQAAGVGAATNDIVAKLGCIEWSPAVNV